MKGILKSGKAIAAIITMIFALAGCGGGGSSSSQSSDESTNETSLNLVFSAVEQQSLPAQTPDSSPSFSGSAPGVEFAVNEVDGDLYRGSIIVENLDDGEQETYDLSIFFNAETFQVESTKTFILSPGNYQFRALFTQGDHQYAGVSEAEITDGQNTIDLSIRPIIGDTISDVSIVERLADFKLQYNPEELAAASLTAPQMGIILNQGTEEIITLNPATGISDQYINLPSGAHNLKLKLYDGSLQRGRSVVAQEDIMVVPGNPVSMDLVALHGETMFSISEEGGDATFRFNIPAEVIDEAGGTEDLQALLSVVGTKNELQESILSLIQDASGDYTAEVIYPGFQYEEVTISIAFSEISTTESLGTCNTQTILDTTEKTVNCELVLRRRAVISGTLLGVLGINVTDEFGIPVPGATVSQNGEILGVTGSGDFGTAGYLKLYLNPAEYTLRAEDSTHFGEKAVTIQPLNVSNLDIQLNQELVSVTTLDEVANLLWQDDGDFTKRTWSGASSFCTDLSLDGYSDWRLPSTTELQGIAARRSILNSYPKEYNSSGIELTSYHWSNISGTLVLMGDSVTIPAFGGPIPITTTGNVFTITDPNALFFVRCVRNNE